jgi:hypothetical protein
VHTNIYSAVVIYQLRDLVEDRVSCALVGRDNHQGNGCCVDIIWECLWCTRRTSRRQVSGDHTLKKVPAPLLIFKSDQAPITRRLQDEQLREVFPG